MELQHCVYMNPLLTVRLLTLLCGVVTAAISTQNITTSEPFQNSMILDPDGNYFLFWNQNTSHVTFEVHVKTRGYVGFGLSPNGNMYPGDVIIGWVKDDSVYLKDCHSTAHSAPTTDSSQDWLLISGTENDFGTVLKFVRKINTYDDDDIIIDDATQRVIWSYHTDDPTDENTVQYHGGQTRGTKSMLLLNNNKPPMSFMNEDTFPLEFTSGNYTVPDEETTYMCFGYQMTDIHEKHHMVQFEPIFTAGNEANLHHIVLYRCPGLHPELHGKMGECHLKWPKIFPRCPEVVLAWAAGGGPFYFPRHVGYSVGGKDDFNFYVMQVHYNNPERKKGIVDNSGIRIYLTSQLRQHDVGSFVVGHEVTPFMIIPPGEEEFVTRGYCSQRCINDALTEKGIDEVKFIAGLQHAHLLSRGMITRHFRNGTELEPIINDPNYDFYFQEYRMFNREIVVRKGDSFTVECTYNSKDRTSVTFGGLSGREEMCETMLYMYPKLDRLTCSSYPDLGTYYNSSLYSEPAWTNFAAILKPHFTSYVEGKFDWNDPVVKLNFTQILKTVDYDHRCSGINPDKPNYGTTYYRYKEPGPHVPYQHTTKPSSSVV